MIELPEVLLNALDEQHGQPLRLIDSRTSRAYLLVSADLFERIEYAEEEPGMSSREVAALIAKTIREEDEGDPLSRSARGPS
jgi:hypothetical protein